MKLHQLTQITFNDAELVALHQAVSNEIKRLEDLVPCPHDVLKQIDLLDVIRLNAEIAIDLNNRSK